jgi:hypothetical protein
MYKPSDTFLHTHSIYCGTPTRVIPHTTTGRADYFGPVVSELQIFILAHSCSLTLHTTCFACLLLRSAAQLATAIQHVAGKFCVQQAHMHCLF